MPALVQQELEINDIPEEDTIRRAQEGNAAAFELLYRRYSRRVYALCLRMARNTSEAEDLTQEAFLLVFRKIRTFRGESKFATWLHRLTVNLVLMGLRKKRHPEVSLDAALESGEEDSKPLTDIGGPDLRRKCSFSTMSRDTNTMKFPRFWDARPGIPNLRCTRRAFGFVNCCRKSFAVVRGRNANQPAERLFRSRKTVDCSAPKPEAIRSGRQERQERPGGRLWCERGRSLAAGNCLNSVKSFLAQQPIIWRSNR